MLAEASIEKPETQGVGISGGGVVVVMLTQ